MKKPLVLVTGGAGFIGSHTVDILIKNGYRVRILDNLIKHSNKWPKYVNKKAIKLKGDVRNIKDWEKALKGVTYVVHIAAIMDLLPEFSTFFDHNTKGTANLYEVLVKEKIPIKKVIIASSQFVYGQGGWKCAKHGIVFPTDRYLEDLKQGLWDPVCPKCNGRIKYLINKENEIDPPNQYAISKYTQELIALKLGKLHKIPTVAFRYSIVHGSRQSIKSLYSGALRQFVLYLMFDIPLYCYEDGMQIRDYVSVKDVATAHLLALRKKELDYNVYNVGGGKAYTILELAKIVSKVMNKPFEIHKSGEYRLGDIRHAFSDISKLKKIGWKPRVSEKENIMDFVKWVKSNKPSKLLVEKAIQSLKSEVAIGQSVTSKRVS